MSNDRHLEAAEAWLESRPVAAAPSHRMVDRTSLAQFRKDAWNEAIEEAAQIADRQAPCIANADAGGTLHFSSTTGDAIRVLKGGE